MSELLTVREAAELLRLSEASIYQKHARGKLGVVKLGSTPQAPLRVPQAEVKRYLERYTVGVLDRLQSVAWCEQVRCTF